MRVIGGTARGRKLLSPKKRSGKFSAAKPIRPTSDRVREAIFNIIGAGVAGATVLDLFAGTGALGIEALSRGAGSAVFVDVSSSAVSLIKRNIDLCGFTERSLVMKRDLARGLSFLKGKKPAAGFDLIFADPPYGRGLSAHVLIDLDRTDSAISAGGLLVVEEAAGESLPVPAGRLELSDQRRYGDTTVWFYRVRAENNA